MSYESVVNNDTTDDAGTRTLQVQGGFVGDRTDNGPGAGRMPAFIGLARQTGGVYAENLAGLSIEQALAEAGLDFTVELRPFEVPDGDNPPIPGLDRMRAVIGTWKSGAKVNLGIAGKGYTPAQPMQTAALGQAVLDEVGATIVAAAAYGDPIGSRMYLALKMPEGLTIGGQDPHDLYLTIGNSYNRETGLWGCAAPIRVRCTNQSTGIFRGNPHRFAFRHTAGMEFRLSDVRAALDLAGNFATAYAQSAELLLTAPMVGGEVTDFVKKLMPTPPTVKTDRGADNWIAKRAEVRKLIEHGEHNDVGRGTRYAALQGVTEWADHVKPAGSPYGRYMRLVDGGGETEALKCRAAALLMSGL